MKLKEANENNIIRIVDENGPELVTKVPSPEDLTLKVIQGESGKPKLVDVMMCNERTPFHTNILQKSYILKNDSGAKGQVFLWKYDDDGNLFHKEITGKKPVNVPAGQIHALSFEGYAKTQVTTKIGNDVTWSPAGQALLKEEG